MTPVLPNPPPSPFDKLLDQKDHHDFQQFDHYHHHLCLSSHDNQLPCDDQRLIQFQAASQQQHQFKVDQYSSHHRSSDVQVFSSSSSHQANISNRSKREVIGDGSTSENGSSPKWMSSKIRLMQKMMNTNCTSRTTESEKNMKKLEYQFQESNEIINSLSNNKSTVRVCSDCNTTTTPLWRSGPRGPKVVFLPLLAGILSISFFLETYLTLMSLVQSLCNACGIRQRKARRAMEAAAAAGNATTAATIDTGSTKIKIQHKEKKSRTNHIVGQYKKQCKPQGPPADQISQRNLCFKDFALSLSKNSSALKQVLPQDVEEAAILLMELSCGFIQS
ncbi:hypothetical protein Dsin_011566 [Dipteronia sinensis]|uniref:GATA-type domain-containing protein n=1 Tax=Dipteronia sinensis TaxID=43782 RepID=A0AAE0EDQ7_9ROSI|nr:hypothetical protein Dsin_011566 [Dipteronia sinensis]